MRANAKCPEVEMLSESAAKMDLSPEGLCRVNCLWFTCSDVCVLVRAREAVLVSQLQLGNCTVLSPGKFSGGYVPVRRLNVGD